MNATKKRTVTVRNWRVQSARRVRRARSARRGIGALGIVALLGVGFLGFQLLGGFEAFGLGGGPRPSANPAASASPLGGLGRMADGLMDKVVGGIEGLWAKLTGEPRRDPRPPALAQGGPFPPATRVVPVVVETGPLASSSTDAGKAAGDGAPAEAAEGETATDAAGDDAEAMAVAPDTGAETPSTSAASGSPEPVSPGPDLAALQAAVARAYRGLRATLPTGDRDLIERARVELLEANRSLADARREVLGG